MWDNLVSNGNQLAAMSRKMAPRRTHESDDGTKLGSKLVVSGVTSTASGLPAAGRP